jgi:hypothetical protein
MPYISLGQNKLEAIFSYPRLFLLLDKYSKIPLQLQLVLKILQLVRARNRPIRQLFVQFLVE